MRQRQHNLVTDLFSPDRLGIGTSSRLTMIFFSHPANGADLFQMLVTDEDRPHGLIGEPIPARDKIVEWQPVSSLHRCRSRSRCAYRRFAFTSEHLKRVFDLAAKIGVSDLSQVRNGDDILLSFSGTKRPRIHPLKPALLCASEVFQA